MQTPTRWCALQAVAGLGPCRPRRAYKSRLAMRVLVTAVLAVLVAAAPAPGFERAGDRKILVLAGRQEVPTIDPSVKYDWSIRMMQQAVYDGLVRYVSKPPKIAPWLAERRQASPNGKTRT